MQAALRDGLSDADSEACLDRWIDAVESRGLAFGGGDSRNGTFEGFITRAGRASATAEDRQVLAAVLAADAAVIDQHFGPLVDAWHGWD